ncbi:protein KATNIP homolog [Oppia nitens]|uniref:protein KATNIP homolog n=1 Tax=Oppia nitens TaxID=1686743 RepID=UPI0023D9F95C|nr:protein KATNIP homolog [Oppia nitens]
MSFLTPLSTIELNLHQTKETNNSDEDISMTATNGKKLPKWLLEFESFSVTDNQLKSDSKTRPLTESSVSQRPQWFKELIQQRRSSEVLTGVDSDNDLFAINKHKLEINELDRNVKHRTNTLLDDHNLLLNNHIIAKSFVSIPIELQNKSKIQNQSKSLQNAFKSCEDLSFQIDDHFIDFTIPELPFGRQLEIEIINNWGDEDYVGFNGIEIIDLNEFQVEVNKIWSNYHLDSDLNTLVDGIYRTHDDSHIWCTQLDAKCRLPLKIFIQFKTNISIALIRIWNYNKSRIYSYRGIKFITISLDNKLIFRGEIAKASGTLIAPIEAFGDTILFTTDEDILESVAQRDQSFQELVNEIIPLTL